MSDFTWGTITALAPLRIQLDGDAAQLPITPDSLVDPLTLAVSDRVRVERSLKRVIVHGKASPSQYTQAQVNALLTHRNQIINGAMNIWQRGTSFASPASLAYTADRWQVVYDGTGATRTISQQAFTVGSEVCEAPYFLRWAQTVAGSGGTQNSLIQRVEGVQVNANGTVTVSFWARLAAAANITVRVGQNFGTGGSATVTTATQTVALTTSFARYSATFTPASITGKTIGAGHHFFVEFGLALNSTFTFDIAGVQAESGSVMTPFERTPIMDDLSRCQRYCYRVTIPDAAGYYFYGVWAATSLADVVIWVAMRATPTVTFSNLGADSSGSGGTVSAVNSVTASDRTVLVRLTTGATGVLNGGASFRRITAGSVGWLAMEAEL